MKNVIFFLLVLLLSILQGTRAAQNTCETVSFKVSALDFATTTKLGQDLLFSTRWWTNGNIKGPIKADLSLRGGLFGTIPCVNGVGSCVYNNACTELRGAFCDLSRGHHSVENIRINIPNNPTLVGDYSYTLTLFEGSTGRKLACMIGNFRLEP